MDIKTLEQIRDNFIKELEQANRGVKNSIPFIKHTIPHASLVPMGTTFQVVVLGGSVVKNALVKKTKDGIVIVKEFTYHSPGFPTGESFLSYVASLLFPETTFLAINLAEALDPVFENGRLDGIFILPSKENKMEGLLYKRIGKTLEAYLKKQGKTIVVSIANDTVCLLLSGLTQFKAQNLAAGIDGTGVNFACFLNNTTLVNLESGVFDKFTQTPTGKIIDDTSLEPRSYKYEKEIAGAYLYKHFNLTKKTQNISFRDLHETKQLSRLAKQHIPKVSKLAFDTLQRSAQFLSCGIAGITNFRKRNLIFVVQGSVFWRGYKYKEIIKKIVAMLCPKYTVRFIKVKNSEILGAAKLIA